MTELVKILESMAAEIGGSLAMGIVGMDGYGIAHFNSMGAPIDALDAKFAMVMKLIDRTVNDIPDAGHLDENLVQTENMWFLTKFLSHKYYIGITMNRSTTLGQARLVANKYAPTIRNLLENQ